MGVRAGIAWHLNARGRLLARRARRLRPPGQPVPAAVRACGRRARRRRSASWRSRGRGALDSLYERASTSRSKSSAAIGRSSGRALAAGNGGGLRQPFAAAAGGSRPAGRAASGRQVLLNFEHMSGTASTHALPDRARAADRPRGDVAPVSLADGRQQRAAQRQAATADREVVLAERDSNAAARPATPRSHRNALLACRLWASPCPSRARAVRRGRPGRPVAGGEVRAGTPALLGARSAPRSRVCVAAESGADIAGTLFRLGGEPLTPARAERDRGDREHGLRGLRDGRARSRRRRLREPRTRSATST